MEGLLLKQGMLHLPHSKQTVPIVYFNARDVFASLLSCPALNRDDQYMFSDYDTPFKIPSPESKSLGDINTGRCYQATYKKIVKDKNLDMLLPCTLAMHKTHIDTYGRMAMEPITVSHGLLKHEFRSRSNAMRILGYFNLQQQKTVKGMMFQVNSNSCFNVDRCDIPEGIIDDHQGISWSTLSLNEMHMQIEFILKECGYLDLQNKGFKWKIHFKRDVYPVVFHPFFPFIVGDTEEHDRLCGHYTSRGTGIASFVASANVHWTRPITPCQNTPTVSPKR